MQQIIIAGTIGKDAELRTTQGGDKVASFTVAVSNGKDKSGNWRESTWYDASLWGPRAESMAHILRKGGKVTLTGRPTCREYNGKAYLGVSVDQITLQGGGQSDRDTGSGYQEPSGYGAGGRGGYDLDSDAIPFAPEWRV